MPDRPPKVPMEVNQVLQQISDPALRVALKMLFIQNAEQHKENQMALGKAVSETKVTIDTAIAEVKRAFPNNDLVGHHDAHQNWMLWAQRANRALNIVFEAIVKLSGVSLFIWVLYKLTGITFGSK